MRFTDRTGHHARHARPARATLPHASPNDEGHGGSRTYEIQLTAEIARELAIEAKARRTRPRDLISLIVTDVVLEDAEGGA